MKRQRQNIDLKVFCDSGHEPQLMVLCIGINQEEEMRVQCATCNRTCLLWMNPRKVFTTFFGEEVG